MWKTNLRVETLLNFIINLLFFSNEKVINNLNEFLIEIKKYEKDKIMSTAEVEPIYISKYY